jgi:hypothetical protein
MSVKLYAFFFSRKLMLSELIQGVPSVRLYFSHTTSMGSYFLAGQFVDQSFFP